MTFIVEPWHWIVIGLFLTALEIFLASFTVFWFGLAAIIVGVIAYIFPQISLEVEMLLWIISSIGLAFYWFKVIVPKSIDRTMAGLPREAILGQVGIVTIPPSINRVGTMRFTVPILGSDEWHIRCLEALTIGDRVMVADILGNELVVNKI